MTLTHRGRLVAALTVIGVVIGIPALGGYLFLRSIGFTAAGEPGTTVEVAIPKGASTQEIGEILEEEGVIKSALGFRLAVFVDGGAADIQAGRYELPSNLSARAALEALLEAGPAVDDFVTVTFPEGSWLEDFAATLGDETHIGAERFLELVTSDELKPRLLPDGVDTLEGLLFPSTYQVIERDTARSVARRLIKEFQDQIAGLDFAEVRAMGYSPYDAVIVASMVEAEAKVDDDRAKIATVIYNRLREGMALGIDATVLYALGEHKPELTRSDLQVDSPYNTRRYAGLPPTPIGAPGLESLRAATNPAEGGWLYYVLADCDGHHAFSESYQDFLNDKAAYQTLDCS